MDQPIPTPISQPTGSNPVGLKWPLIAIFSFFLGIASVFAYQKWQPARSNLVGQSPTPAVAVSPSPAADPTAGWKTYTDNTYSFKFPPNWQAVAGDKVTEEYFGGDYVSIISPVPAVSINIAPGIFTYGFSGFGDTSVQRRTEEIKLVINGNEYTTLENIRVENNITKAYVDLEIPRNDKKYHMLFGTGYPVNEDIKASFNDYLAYKDDIYKILSTFKFTEASELKTNKVIGIKLSSCCPCPEKIDQSLIGKDGWVIYEQGKDYTDLLPEVCSNTRDIRGQCAPCLLLENE